MPHLNASAIRKILSGMLLGVPMAAFAASTSDIDTLFSWAEISYPQLFASAPSGSLQASGYRYRFYPDTNSYLGIKLDDDQLVLLQPPAAIKALGPALPYIDQSRIPPTASTNVMLRYLKAGLYRNWPAESAIHASTGPHFGKVRTWVNPVLAASLATGATEHPLGSAAVKELYGNSNTAAGWAVMVRTQAGTGGKSWYWYEQYGKLEIAGQGDRNCTGCHAAGRDQVLTPFPLR
jgi:hypothetical protein